MNSLAGKVTIVTGASSGIGYATSKLFAREGAKVVVAARRQTELDALVDEIIQEDGIAIALAGDVKDESFAKALLIWPQAASEVLMLPSIMPAPWRG